jgi:photosystem II stability/assembly factor-like uncharacterized protein
MKSRNLRALVVAATAFAGVLPLAAAAPVDPAWFQGLEWRHIGPFRGGRVLAVAGVPGERLHFYFGSVNGGVWETLDAGRTWTPIFDDQPVGSIGALALAPSNPKRIYVGTGEADMRSDISQGDGMFRSDDGGRNWRAIGLADSQQIGRIAVHPANPDLVFVAALGHPYGPNAERGLFRSRDGGGSWQKLLGPNDDTGAIDVTFEPGNPDVLYAALWQTRRTPWSVYPPSNGPGSGVFKSTDGGESWSSLAGRGLPPAHGRVGLAVSPSRPDRVYAIVDAEPGGGLYRSDDRGASWRRLSADTRLWGRGWYFGRVEVHPANADQVYVMNTILLRSDDGGATFAPIQGDPTGDDFHELWIDPADPGRRILGVDQGAIVTLNGGETWSSWHNQPTAQIYRLATDDRFPYMVYGSQQDSGAAGVPSRTTQRDGITMREFKEPTAGGENDNIAPDPRDPQIVFGGRVVRLDLRTNQTRNVDPTLAVPDFHRSAWTLPLVFSRRQPGVLYFANQRLYRTADDGETWTTISPDLTREDPGTPANLDAPTAALHLGTGPRRGVIYAIAPSRLADRDLWVGTDDGLVWRTRDEGANWLNVTPKALTPWSKVGMLDASHFDAETAYAAIDRHRLDDFSPHIYRTHDGGATWTEIVDGIAPTHFVNVLREDSVRKGLLFAGTERGVYVSFDDGGHWQPLQLELPVTSVRDLEVKGNDLVIATHGRGFWILDDITPLRQIDAAALAAPSTLFAPAKALRVRPEGFTGTPLPKEEPAAENPPSGAYVDYYLAAAPAAPIVLTVRDARGEIVRRYSSTDAPKPIDLATLRSAPEWVEEPVTLASAAGAHRFVWPLRYAAPREIAKDNAFTDGVWAPPGVYKIELEVDGRRHEQPLEVAPDPRVALPSAAYTEQFALARRIEALQARLKSANDAAEAIQKALTAKRSAASPKLSRQLEDFQRELSAVSGVQPAENPSNSWWKPPATLTSLRALSDRLGDLMSAVDGADAAPSPDARQAYDVAERLVNQGLKEWERFRGANRTRIERDLEIAGADLDKN